MRFETKIRLIKVVFVCLIILTVIRYYYYHKTRLEALSELNKTNPVLEEAVYRTLTEQERKAFWFKNGQIQ